MEKRKNESFFNATLNYNYFEVNTTGLNEKINYSNLLIVETDTKLCDYW